MEAPDKIYLIRNFTTPTSLNTTNDHHEKYLQEWYKSREKDTDVEYIRTDVFIKKALKWMISQGGVDDVLSREMIEDFKTHIKENNL